MKKLVQYEKILLKIQKAEGKLAYATPKQAAKLTVKIVKWKTCNLRRKIRKNQKSQEGI